jgi:hypothetical protein
MEMTTEKKYNEYVENHSNPNINEIRKELKKENRDKSIINSLLSNSTFASPITC